MLPAFFRPLLAVSAVAVVACAGGGCVGAPAAAVGSCSGAPRPQLDCSTEVKYDATNVQGSLHVGAFAAASGGTEQKALREIDQQTARYIAAARRLCDEYNKCVVDPATYATRSENLRRRLARVPELLEGVRSASDDDAQRAALANAYREIVPDDARSELRVAFSVLASRPGEASLAPIAQDAALQSGSRVAFGVEVSRPAYVYLFQRSAAGSIQVLFPDARIAVQNPVVAATPLQVPQGGLTFKLDDKDVGTERVYIVASLHPVASLAAAAQQAGSDVTPGGGVAQVTAIDGSCKSRGLTLDEGAGAPSGGCARPRGLMLADGGPTGGKSSLVATTEAADDTIATVFSFRHIH